MYKIIKYSKQFVMILFVLSSLVVSNVYATTVSTELEKNKNIYKNNESELVEARRIDKVGELLLEPVKTIKEGTENILFHDYLHITHDEIQNKQYSNNLYINNKVDGPKLSISF